MRKFVSITLLLMSFATVSVAQKIPDADVPGASDSEVAGRLPGAITLSHFSTPLDQATFPKSVLLKRGDRVGNNVYLVSPDEELVVEGTRTRNVYLLEPGVSPFAAIRAYEATLEEAGANLVYSCKSDGCGGTANRAGGLGGGWMTLAYYLWPDDRITDGRNSAGYCAQTGYIGNQEYRLYQDANQDTTVSVHAYTLKPSQFSSCRENFDTRVVVTVDVIAPDAEPIGLTVVSAGEMQSQISETGKIALYGINFNTGQDSLREDSADTIIQIADLLKADSDLRLLIVGHTDSQGSFDFNQDLSERRARSVVQALVNNHGIAQSRLFPVGVSFASPLAPNNTEEGRAQNRRVELVQF